MRYPGGKNGGGVYHTIINQIPPHRVYCEPFVGSGAILRMKRLAEKNLGIDLDPGAVARLAVEVPESVDLMVGCGIKFLDQWCPPDGTMIYCDPPYLETLTPQRYTYKMHSIDHERLLCVLRKLPRRVNVLVSGYRSELYEDLIGDWRTIEFPVWTRGGCWATEVLWANYPEPRELHDYRFLGADHRKRLDIKRQQQRWRKKLQGMNRLQRLALMSVLSDLEPGADAETTAAAGTVDVPSNDRRQHRQRRRPATSRS